MEEAREVLTRLWHEADDRGEPSSFALQRLHVCELELRVGAWDAAELLLDEWGESTDSYLLLWPMYERCRALLAAGRGEVGDAVRWAEDATARGRSTGSRRDQLEAQRALGAARLLGGVPEVAAEALLGPCGSTPSGTASMTPAPFPWPRSSSRRSWRSTISPRRRA